MKDERPTDDALVVVRVDSKDVVEHTGGGPGSRDGIERIGADTGDTLRGAQPVLVFPQRSLRAQSVGDVVHGGEGEGFFVNVDGIGVHLDIADAAVGEPVLEHVVVASLLYGTVDLGADLGLRGDVEVRDALAQQGFPVPAVELHGGLVRVHELKVGEIHDVHDGAVAREHVLERIGVKGERRRGRVGFEQLL